MSVSMIPVDPDKLDDIYYRYKMPAIQTKVEGSGNGIKTVFPNIHDVCLAINRPEEVLMKFFQSEMGAQRTVLQKDDKFLIMGSHAEERVQEKVYDFIRKFVLCRHCRNPETQLSIGSVKKGTQSVSLSCGACGKVMPLNDLGTRYVTALNTYYLKNPQAIAKKGAGTAAARSGDNAATTAAAEAEAVPSAPIPSAPAVVQQTDLKETRDPPQKVFEQYMRQHPDDSEENIRRCLEICSSYNLDEKFGPLLVLQAIVMVEKDLMSGIRRHARLLQRFATLSDAAQLDTNADEARKTELLAREARLQRSTIDECARICARQNAVDKFPILLFVVFIEGALKSTTIEEWYNDTKPVSKLSEEVRALMKETIEPLFKWFTS